MFEYHGWVTVRDGVSESEDDSVLHELNCRDIEATIAQYKDDMSRVELYYQNGSPYVRLDGDRNHYKSWVLDLFIQIGKIAKGLHSLLYIRDDESPEHHNGFQVWRMTGSGIIQMKDILLSPCDPLIKTYEK
ncbi:Imm7 family immunity protein [Gynuella sp.]|uniref:Imm7 family immunity protein n=1 Tax=Gynuella sp. TaxID=2969146 RepID=UPI003D0F04D5